MYLDNYLKSLHVYTFQGMTGKHFIKALHLLKDITLYTLNYINDSLYICIFHKGATRCKNTNLYTGNAIVTPEQEATRTLEKVRMVFCLYTMDHNDCHVQF